MRIQILILGFKGLIDKKLNKNVATYYFNYELVSNLPTKRICFPV